jgi:pimeloyl-ACP methyl ester carboxylesterase
MPRQAITITLTRLGVLTILASTLLASCEGNIHGSDPARSAGAIGLELSPCRLRAPGLPVRVPAECGALEVPEDRAAPQSRTLALRIAVVPAVSRAPAPDPLVFLTGGPGQAATESYVPLATVFRRFNEDRDIVLVDQRGTGGSNALRCPRPDEAENAGELWLFDEEQTRDWVGRCLTELESHADPRFYSTSVAVRDLDEVRAALGYQTVNLYGLSYGTRVALEYLRRHPERVRSVVLDGVVPPTEVLGLNVARDAQRALDLLEERCRNDPLCDSEFPSLENSANEVISRLEQPTTVSLRHPRDGSDTQLMLHSSMAAFAIRLLSYSAETAALVPVLLREARDGDLSLLAAQFLLTSSNLDETMSEAMGYTVICSEDYPRFDASEIEQQHRGTYLGSVQIDNLERLCPSWPRGPVNDDFHDPVVSSVPTLLLSGEADPVTPPSNADTVAESLSNAHHLVVGGHGHMVVHRGCIPNLVEAFLEQGSLDPVRDRDACVDAIAPSPFFLGFSGPTP